MALLRSLGSFLLVLALGRQVQASPVLIDRVVARVNSEPILWSEVLERSRPQISSLRATTADELRRMMGSGPILQATLDQLIDARIYAQAAKEMHLNVAEESIDKAMEDLAVQNHITRAQLMMAAYDQGMTEQDYRRELREVLLAWMVINQVAEQGHKHIVGSEMARFQAQWLQERKTVVCIERFVRF